MPKPSVATILGVISLFLFFFLLRFPFQNLKGLIFGKIFKATGVFIIAEDLYPSLFGWPGVGMKNVSVTVPLASSELNLECRRLIARVGIGGLIPPSGSISLGLKGLKKGGDLYVQYLPNRAGLRASLEADGVELSQLSPSAASPIATGFLDFDGSIWINEANIALTTGEGTLRFTDLKLGAQNIQGIVLSEMKLGAVKGEFAIKNGTASIPSFQIGETGADVQGTLTGEIKLDSNWDNSTMNLVIKLKLAPSYISNPDSATITSFLNTFKLNDGEYSIRLNATIAQFNQSSILLLQKGI